jgi:hypothetical protein
MYVLYEQAVDYIRGRKGGGSTATTPKTNPGKFSKSEKPPVTAPKKNWIKD